MREETGWNVLFGLVRCVGSLSLAVLKQPVGIVGGVVVGGGTSHITVGIDDFVLDVDVAEFGRQSRAVERARNTL